MTKLENENESSALDGYFYPLKTPVVLSKISGFQSPSSSGDKFKDYIDIKVKVVSTQLTQNGNLSII